MRDDREEILRQLDAGGGATAAGQQLPPPQPPPLPLPAAGGDLPAALAAAAAANQSAVQTVAALADVPAVVAAFLKQKQAPLQALCEEEFLPLPWRQSGMQVACQPPGKDDTCGITGVIAAAADSGVMLLADDTPQRLTLSLLPPYHVAVVPARAICADLSALWRRLPQPPPRGCVLVGGPSRTADIEQTLTLGMHGPIGVLVVIVR